MNRINQALKSKIIELDYVLLGTLLKRYKQCGKINCKCMKDNKHWHGPYYIWTRKEKGKTITKTLNKTQAQFVLKAFKNMMKLNKIVDKMKELSLRKIDEMK